MMKKRIFALLTLSLLALLTLSACGLLQEPEEVSGPIEAIPLATQAAGVVATEAVAATEPTAAPTEAPTATTAAPAGTATTFTIDPAASQVRFQLDEDLRGERKTVVGSTDQVAGQLSINLFDLNQTRVGIIQINARALTTDNNFRNRAIQNEILDTGQYEFITFTPTGIEGLPAGAAVGQTVSFNLVGDLTIRDVTLPATFAVEATVVSDTQIAGAATAVINRADFGLQIPSVPNVANVEEEVELYIDFTANAS
jgi:polyisoprenoid-binding protein YceI